SRVDRHAGPRQTGLVVRVVYRWRVRAGCEQEFVSAWADQTRLLRDSVEGARGSMLLRAADEADVYVGIARWTDAQAWAERRSAGPIDPQFSEVMEQVATLVSVEVLDEVETSLG